MKHDDEYDLNIGLWRHHAWKQWCRFIPWSDEKVPTLDPQRSNIESIGKDQDS